MNMLVLLSALPLLAAGFLLDIFIHRQESFAAIVAARGLIHVVLGSGKKEAKSLEEATGEVVKQIHAALHPEFVSLLHRQEDQLELRPIGYAKLVSLQESPGRCVSWRITAIS